MTPEELHRSFPDDITLPDLLVRLCAFTDGEGGNGGTIAADLALNPDGRDFLDYWFDRDTSAANQFVVFASDGADALYGYWRYEGQPLDRAPLVYLNDEAPTTPSWPAPWSSSSSLSAWGRSTLAWSMYGMSTKRPTAIPSATATGCAPS